MPNEARSAMVAALKASLVPALRSRGFRGSFPHFRRLGPTRVDLLSVQFWSSGGRFAVEVGSCPPTGTRLRPAKQAKVAGLPGDARRRLGAPPQGGDRWFVFVEPSDGAATGFVGAAGCAALAAEVVALLDSEAEPYWAAWAPPDVAQHGP